MGVRAMAAVALAVSCASANAGWTGRELLEMGSLGDSGRSMLAGYVSGVMDSEAWLIVLTRRGHANKEALTICVPAGVTPDQAADVVLKAIRENPQDRHLAAILLVRRALANAWACPSD